MSILCDKTLKKELDANNIIIKPRPGSESIQPASIDLQLSNDFIMFDETLHVKYINRISSKYVLQPGEFILGSTKEYIEVPEDMVARVEGRSSYGRLGLLVHVTAGFIDPGFKGTITLELKNISNQQIVLNENDKICQIVFEQLDNKCEQKYDGHYQGQKQTRMSVIKNETTKTS